MSNFADYLILIIRLTRTDTKYSLHYEYKKGDKQNHYVTIRDINESYLSKKLETNKNHNQCVTQIIKAVQRNCYGETIDTFHRAVPQ